MRLLGICLLFLFCQLSYSQQHPSYTQFNFNRYLINPAIAGYQPCGEMILGNRRQWVGFEGAPSTYFASFNTRHNKEDKYPENFHGYGFNLINEQYGFTTNVYLKLGYAYNMKLQRNFRVSVGLFAGIQNFSQNYRNIIIANRNIDPALRDEASSYVYPEISPGIFIYNKKLFAGATIIQGYPARIKDYGTRENRLSSHYFLHGGYRFKGRKIDFVPSFLFYMSPFASPTMDITFDLDYKQIILLGAGSKYLNSGYLKLQIRALRSVTVAYSYEYALNNINQVAPNTHEIALRFRLCHEEKRIEKFICPAYQ